jgi:small subunit ribosomal protein S8
MTGQSLVAMPSSKIKLEIARILKEEGYIENFELVDGDQPTRKRCGAFEIRRGAPPAPPVITGLERISRPGRRMYTRKTEIPWVLSGLGIAILSTPKGVMTGQRARQLGVGGEILCKVW